ncbi:MAG: thiamine-phosphate kinase [Bacillota bacterium]
MRLKDLGEFGLINHLTREMRSYDASVVLGIGDDAAAFKVSGDRFILITCDMLIEGRHFLLDKIKPSDLGRKALAVNLSDIAAVGGVPRHAVVSAGWPDYVDVGYAEQVYAGIREIAGSFGVNILGGDTVRAPQLVLDITVIGESARPPVTRSGARPGDVIAVTGRVGASAAGLDLLLAGHRGLLPEAVRDRLIAAHVRPVPRVREAAVLAEAGARAMIDISDGLASEVNHICNESGTGAVIYADRLPVDDDTRLAAEEMKQDWLRWALFGGEDYELVVALPKAQVPAAQAALRRMCTDFSVIGEVTERKHGVNIVLREGAVPLNSGGYDHFGRD